MFFYKSEEAYLKNMDSKIDNLIYMNAHQNLVISILEDKIKNLEKNN